MKTCFYAGSFDPFTNGHLHVVKEASKLFDKVYVGIGVNPGKSRHYKQEDMKEIIMECLKDENIFNVEIIVYSGLTIDCATSVGATYFVRGIRNGMDYEYEENLAAINEELAGINTIYIRAGEYGIISSSFVRELLKYNKSVEKYVPTRIAKYLEGK